MEYTGLHADELCTYDLVRCGVRKMRHGSVRKRFQILLSVVIDVSLGRAVQWGPFRILFKGSPIKLVTQRRRM